MTTRRYTSSFSWTLYFLAYFVCMTRAKEHSCPYPSVPSAATYVNISGGVGESEWRIKYACDPGYELFGRPERSCEGGEWEKEEDLPHCAVNVALHKPAMSSSSAGGSRAGAAVDGSATSVHEGSRCTETESEKSPWWTVDLLASYPVRHVRLTTRCCDGFPVRKAEIRVGNFSTPGENSLCNWIPQEIEEGATKTLDCYGDLIGRYVSVIMTGVDAVLSLCEVEVFSDAEPSPKACGEDSDVFRGECYKFLKGETSGYEEAVSKCQGNFNLINHLDDDSTKYLKSKLDRELQNRDQLALMTWVGAKRDADSTFGRERWTWVNGGSVDDISWGKGQPNNYNQEQNCAVLDSELEWGWNDISCRISGAVVCQGPPIKCPSPPVAVGTYYTGSHNVGETITYHCLVGEMPVGQREQTCLASTGDWSGEPVRCKKIDCGQVPGLANGEVHVLDGRTTWGARVRYKCKKDYTLREGDGDRVCEELGWTGRAPQCVYTKCAEPDAVDNADLRRLGKKGNVVGSRLVYTCLTGHVASGSLSRECQLGGKWSGSPPSCQFVDCKDPPSVAHGKFRLLDGRTTFAASVEYYCDENYELSSTERTRQCLTSGQWSPAVISCKAIECPIPRAPSGGRVSGYDRGVGAVVEYSCLTGHILEGVAELTCLADGRWSQSSPICRFVDCGALPDLADGTTHYVNGSTHLGSLVKHSCGRTHAIIGGHQERTCQENGRWSGDQPTCEEIRCSLPPRPNNTVVSVSSTERLHGTSVIRSKLDMKAAYRVGSTLKYRCERGYILQTEGGSKQHRVVTRRCTTSGEWTGQQPTCTFVDCGPPEKPENARVALQLDGTYYGSVALYECEDHFNLDGFEKSRCEADGQWKPEAPNCTETLCKSLTSPDHGSMILTTLRIGGRATFECEQGFALKGDDDIECLSSGSWSSWPPTCVEIDCGDPGRIDNGRIFLASNGSTKIGARAEYHCFPSYEREGPFTRECLEDGFWSGREPECKRPRPKELPILRDNTVDGTTNVRAGSRPLGGGSGDATEREASSVGTWIGVALGLIVVVGLLILGGYFYRKRRAIASKPAPYSGSSSSGHGPTSRGGPSDYLATGVYGGSAASTSPSNGALPAPPRIGQRPPPPIQMYSMDDASSSTHLNGGGSNGILHDGGGGLAADARGPIYDTINDDSSGSGYSRASSSNAASNSHHHYGGSSTFGAGLPPVARTNGGYSHEYDVPEGAEHLGGGGRGPVGAVTINGIAV